MLTRDQILGKTTLRRESVEVPEWGGTVIVKEMNARERDAFEQSIMDGKKANLANVRAKLCARVIVDEQGQRLFSDADVAALGETSAAALDKVFSVAQRLNGMSNADAESLAKNSGGQSGVSASA